jgi:RNA polymerase sigma-70 factor (TIGR02943 family)
MAEIDPERWLDEHGSVLYGFALARVRDPLAAQDLVQEAFLAALKARDQFGGQSSERTWLVGILKHKIMDFFRRKYKDAIVTSSDESEDSIVNSFDGYGHWNVQGGHAPKSWGNDAIGDFERAEFKATLDGCLAGLPPKTAQAFTLREMDERGTEEICKVLNISATNLWVLLHRARTQLRRCLEVNWFGK